MSETITNVTEANFEADVLNSELPVLVDFWAPWCAPCIALTPTIESIATMYDGRIKVIKINCDEAQPLAQRYGARGIPHLIFLHGDKPATVVKARTKTRLTLELDELLMQ
jgi:thioredoxin 1